MAQLWDIEMGPSIPLAPPSLTWTSLGLTEELIADGEFPIE